MNFGVKKIEYEKQNFKFKEKKMLVLILVSLNI